MRIVFHPPLSTISLINLVRNRFGCWGKREGGKDQILGLSPHSPFHSFVYNLRRNRHPLKAKRYFPSHPPISPQTKTKNHFLEVLLSQRRIGLTPSSPKKRSTNCMEKQKLHTLIFISRRGRRTVPPLFLTD